MKHISHTHTHTQANMQAARSFFQMPAVIISSSGIGVFDARQWKLNRSALPWGAPTSLASAPVAAATVWVETNLTSHTRTCMFQDQAIAALGTQTIPALALSDCCLSSSRHVGVHLCLALLAAAPNA